MSDCDGSSTCPAVIHADGCDTTVAPAVDAALTELLRRGLVEKVENEDGDAVWRLTSAGIAQVEEGFGP